MKMLGTNIIIFMNDNENKNAWPYQTKTRT